MGKWNFARFVFSALAIIAAPFLIGCQMTPLPSTAVLTEYRKQLDETGLELCEPIPDVKVSAALPTGWTALAIQKTGLYTHEQWRSPTKRTAVGATYVHMPLPLPAKTLVWFAMNEAGKKSADGRVIRQWSDSLGREWFEAENNKYHMTGYVMTHGFDAWINYFGYRTQEDKEPAEQALARRSLDTFMPLGAVPPPKNETAGAQ